MLDSSTEEGGSSSAALPQQLAVRLAAGEHVLLDLEHAWQHFWCCTHPVLNLDQLGWWASDVLEAHGVTCPA